MLEQIIREKLRQKEILLMTHIVIGYPSFDVCMDIVDVMVQAGVDLMELQIPFSEPMADGPVILKANQDALAAGATVSRCLDFAGQVTASYDIPFLFMSYYNILSKQGVPSFVQSMSSRKIRGAIVPDLPPEEGEEYFHAMKSQGLDPILIFSPNTSEDRMKYLASHATGFIYCVARKGVTGLNTDFSLELSDYLLRCRRATSLPLALGFGVKDKDDVNFLKGKADIAVIGTQTLRVLDEQGLDSVKGFIERLQ